MRIAFSAFNLDGGKSGVGTYVLGLLKSLQGIDLHNHYDLFFKKTDAGLLPNENASFHLIPTQNWLGKPIPNILWHNMIFPRLAKKNHYDLLHVPTMRRIPMVKACPLVATVHDLAPFVLEGKYDPLRMMYHKYYLKRAIHQCDRVITVSKATKADILKFTQYPEEKIDVIYSGVDARLFRPINYQVARDTIADKYGLKHAYFIYVSRIEHPGKNHLRLIQAFEQFIKREKTSHYLVLVGADWSRADLVKKYVARSDLKDRIIFLGFVPKIDIVSLYNACDLMIFPSLYEGFGFPVLEAMACGAPVICSSTPALKEIANGHAMLFDPMNVKEMSYCISLAFEEGNDLQKRERALEYARTFTWTECAKQTLQVYEKTGFPG